LQQYAWLIWDIAALAILVTAVALCARRGLLRTLLGLAAGIASAIGASLLSAPLAAFLYERVVRDIIHMAITRRVSAQIEQEIIGAGNWLSGVPGWAARLISPEARVGGPQTAADILPAVEALIDAALAQPVLMILRTLCFFLLFWVLLAVGRKIIWAARAVDGIPLIGSTNILLGGLLGVGWTALILYLMGLAALLYITMSGGGNAVVNEQALSQGYLFGFFHRLTG